MSTLTFDDVSVTFGRGTDTFTAVQQVDLTVESGTIMGLVGESGSGKSTLARAAVGLHEPSGGRILLDGVDVTAAKGDAARLRRTIQMVFQDPSACLDPRRSVGESIEEALVARARREGGGAARRRARRDEIARLLASVSLPPDLAERYPLQLSGGQRQRIAIARALAAGPRVLLADEITSALDVSVQGAVLNLLVDIHRDLGLTILFVSHNLAIVRHVCDRVAVMCQGRVVEEGPILDVLERPASEYTRSLVDAVPELGVPLW